MSSRPRYWLFGCILGGLALVSTPALADKIDGDWCHVDGRHFTINYHDLTTPGGHHVLGDYGRHSFSYVVPEGEPDSGATVEMMLVNEQTVQLKVSGNNSPPQTFKRCEQVSEYHLIPLASS